MKKILGFMFVIVVAFSLSGCLKSEELEENKIKAPTPDALNIEGIWSINADYKIKEDGKVEKVDNTKQEVNITRKEIKIQSIQITNPKFKFKKVKKIDYLPKDLDGIVKNVKETDGYIDIISISDNTNLYVDFIPIDANKAYIYTVGELLLVSKIEDKNEVVKEPTTEVNDALKTFEKAQGKNSGVLIGIKEPSAEGTDGKLVAKYKTLWVYSKGGKIQEPKVIDGLLLPRMNGSFSSINMNTSKMGRKEVQRLMVDTQNKSGKNKETKNSANDIYREITFVGKDYIGIQYYGDSTSENFNKYKIIPVDSVENNKGLNIESLYGAKGVEAYRGSKEKFLSVKDKALLKDYDIENSDMGNITMLRKNGKWILEGRINSENGDSDLDFDIDIPTTNTLVNWDSIPITWNKIKELNENAVDAVGSPNGEFMVVLTNKSIEVYEIDSTKENYKHVLSKEVAEGSSIVMSEWATGDEFVTAWNNVVDEKATKPEN